MAQKLIYINQSKDNTIIWLKDGSYEYTSSSNKYFRSIVFTNDGYIITHGKVYNGNDTITDADDLQGLGLYQTSGSINGALKTFFVDSATYTAGLPTNLYAPTAIGNNGQVLMSNGSTNVTPSWQNLVDVVKLATSTTNLTTGQVLSNNGTGLTWTSPSAIDTTYKIRINGTYGGTNDADVDLGSVYAPSSAGSAGQILQANSSGIPVWTSLSTSIAGNLASTDKTIPTSYAVYQAIEAAKTQAMIFKGTISSHAQLPSSPANGDVYMVATEHTYNGETYKVGDTLVYRVGESSSGWELIPAGNEQETFITIKNRSGNVVDPYNQKTGDINLGDAALSYVLSGTGTNPISSNTTSTNLVTAAQVVNYVASLGYSQTTGTVTGITAGIGLTGGTISDSGTIAAALTSTTPITGAYKVGVDASGNLAVDVDWQNTTYTYYMGASGATSTVARNPNNDVYVTSKASNSGTSVNLLGLHQGTGISISSNTSKLITITNTAPNVTTTFSMSAITGSPTGAKITFQEGTNTAQEYSIVGSSAAAVSYDATNKKITITGTNTWRPVYAYSLTNVEGTLYDQQSISTNVLAFGSEFGYTNTSEFNDTSEIHLVWAEVDASGNITYTV